MNTTAAPDNASVENLLAQITDEFLQRLEAGEQPAIEEYARRYPAIAEILRQVLPALQVLRGPAAATDAADVATAGCLGDFRILREVGRGGMGIVYEAEQSSLRRRVALKVLPFAATMDPRHLRRFQNEAQAAAGLHHTNIVPVYFVGCERGVHFYAMQFIDGQPLSEVIHQLHGREKRNAKLAAEEPTAAYHAPPDDAIAASPTVRRAADSTPLTAEGRRSRDYFRKVAELGVQAAEALDHAHQVGIVHRDVKPGNLLLDGQGNLWVTDFGLAQMQSDTRLTRTGDLVGTLRYMSPEQALAKRVVIDHRTDIYSLGATLYELLTLQPAFTGEDREELLRQIAFEEPKRLRQVERAIPAELETIVQKAMEKRPQERYATAQEMADDLRRWLLDQSIRARRPSWVQVGRKWARRHQAGVRAASVLLLVLLALGIVNGFWWVQKQTAAETEARTAFDEAVRWQQQERWSEALSAIRRAQGVLHGFGVDADLKRQIDQRRKDLEMAQRLEEARLLITAIKDEHSDYDSCIAAYEAEFAWYGLDLEQADAGAAATIIRSCSISKQLVSALDFWMSLLRWETSRDWKHLLAVARAADESEWRNRLREAWERADGKAMNGLLASADVEKLLPGTISMLDWFPTKDVSGELVAALLRRAQQRHPSDFWINHELASTLYRQQPNQLDEAIGYYRAAVALRPQSPVAHTSLGIALSDKSLFDETIAEDREAIRIEPDSPLPHRNLGSVSRVDGLLDEAIAEYREAIRINKDFAEAHSRLGEALRRKGRLKESVAELRESFRLKKGDAASRDNLRRAEQMARMDERLPRILEGKDQPKDAAERLALAMLCREGNRKLYVTASRFFREAFTELPQFADGLNLQHRYNAACAAALAGCGQGADADKIDAKERSRLRQQALDWLQAHLKKYRQIMEKSADKDLPMLAQRMRWWLLDGDFAGVRGEEALAKLPEEERAAWRKLWADLAEMLAEAQGKASAGKRKDAK